MTNATLLKFGYPATLIAELPTWSILVRPQQVTLGSLVLVCRETATHFGDVSDAGFAQLGPVVRRIERMLSSFVRYEKINYLMLMMVDPDVHFHVLPRYGAAREFADRRFEDAGWPGPPNLTSGPILELEVRDSLTAALKQAWKEAGE